MSKMILIIDDEPDIRTYLMAALEDSGYLTCSLDGGLALNSVSWKEKPDMVLLDIMMPRTSGIAVYRKLRSMPDFRDVPVVLISGMDFDAYFSNNGAMHSISLEDMPSPNAFIEKPIKISALLKTIEMLLKH